jgi:hypothetical protein
MGAVLAMKALICVVAFSMLAGCQSVVQPLIGEKPSAPVVLPAEALSGPQMHVQISSRGAAALLSRVAVNKDVETWLAVDNISLSFRQGILVATRGLGFDLMGADAQNSLDAIAGQGPEVYRRQMRYLTGDNHSTYLTAGCSIVSVGAETVDGQRLQKFEEQCQARQNRFTNLYWQNGSGQIVQSKQWVSPQIGYMTTNLRKK